MIRWKKRLLLMLAVFSGASPLLQAQEEVDPVPEWQQDWARLLTDEELEEQARLEAQTRLLLDAMRTGGQPEAALWDAVTTLLDQWEGSSEINEGRRAYVELLTGFGQLLGGRKVPFAAEETYQAYVQKALNLETGPIEEGRLLLFLAESLLRTEPRTAPRKRRVETLLQEALSVLNDRPPADAVHFRLGDLYSLWPETMERPESVREVPYLSRAVSHFDRILRLPEAREVLKEAAKERLETLRTPELDVQIEHRFLPQGEVRVSVRARNIETLNVVLTGLPLDSQYAAVSTEELGRLLTSDPYPPERVLLDEKQELDRRHLSDWQNRDITLGDSYPPGWYGVIIEGGGIRRDGLLLVSALEVALLSRGNGDLLVWAVDGETGQVVEGASVTFLDESGSVLHDGITGSDGTLSVSRSAASGWTEVSVVAGLNPAHLRRDDLSQSKAPISWVFLNPVDLIPGRTVFWCRILKDVEEATSTEQTVELLFPGGTTLPISGNEIAPGKQVGQFSVPSDLRTPGPVYARIGKGDLVQVAFLHDTRKRPLTLEFSGDRIDARHNLFLESTPVTTHITLSPSEEPPVLPEFIRFRLSRMHRNAVILSEKVSESMLPTRKTLLHERILPLEGIREAGLSIEIPEVSTGGTMVPLVVEILPLDRREPLAVGHLGISPFREVIRFEIDGHLKRPGETLQIPYRVQISTDTSPEPVRGEFAIYRETWESRYIHRRRGTTLSEEAYQGLPDRSLLGAAKTDYRLSEQGFVREEIDRLPVELPGDEGALPVRLDRAGKYIIEFAAREPEIHALYPEGPLEVWVIPEESDLRAFRSEKPRLIIDLSEGGGKEALLLLDRPQPALLIDIEREDGSRTTRVKQPVEAAVFFHVDAVDKLPVKALRIFAVGNGQTDFLRTEGLAPETGEWKLNYTNLFGLNPDSPFAWPLEIENPGPIHGHVFWTFYPEGESPLSRQRVRWQEYLHRVLDEGETLPVAYLTGWLPLWDPFQRRSVSAAPGGDSLPLDYLDPDAFVCLFPEVVAERPASPAAYPFQDVGIAAPTVLEGRFPNASGRWTLAAITPVADGSVHVRDWTVSTELPIRSELRGPSLLRARDRTRLNLQAGNTTGRTVPLEVRVTADSKEGIADGQPTSFTLTLEPLETDIFPIEVEAIRSGLHHVEVELRGGQEVLSRSGHNLEVIPDVVRYGSRFAMATGQRESLELRLSTAGLQAGTLTVNSGIGVLLPELMGHISLAHRDTEPLLDALSHWALSAARAHHGVDKDSHPADAARTLAGFLDEYGTPSGGWSWLPGMEADPWLSALVVWTLEIFSGRDGESFTQQRERARHYLEGILVQPEVPGHERIFALRALAVPAFHFEEVRPSRIQARTLLDFLHGYENRSLEEIAMLLEIARAYRFREEVRLLSRAVQNRLEAGRDGIPFWKLALASLVLGEEGLETGELDSLLASTLEAFAGEPGKRSWMRVCGFLNLVGFYFWNGDFNQEGRASIRIADRDPVEMDLGPAADNPQRMQLELAPGDLLTGSDLSIKVDSSSALSSVFFSLRGKRTAVPPRSVDPSSGVEWFRVYYEPTLMKGLRRKTSPYNPEEDVVSSGENLEAIVEMQLDKGWKYAEVQIPSAAGLELYARQLTHEHTPLTEMNRTTIQLLPHEAGDLLQHTFRLTPFDAGTHLFTLRFGALWPGEYSWPGMRVLNPLSGEIQMLTPKTRMRVTGTADPSAARLQ